jgi:hypothetical protein
MNVMRETGTGGWAVHNSSAKWLRLARLAAVAAGIGLVMSAGIARAEDDEEDDSSISDKVIGGLMRGLGGTNMENTGIEYRERSPLVVPPKLDLPPPDAGSDVKVTNWPKDPDLQARQARAAERKKTGRPEEILEAARPLTPAEMAPKRVRRTSSSGSEQPGNQSTNPMLSPSQLGVEGGITKIFGGNSVQTAPFKGEPTRDSLTQPPTGYQTPSPNYAYGTGPKEVLQNSGNINPMTGKY